MRPGSAGEDGEDGQGVAIAHQPWIEQGLATADGNNTEEPEDTDFHFIPTRNRDDTTLS